MGRFSGDEAGQVLVFFVVVLPLFLMMAGFGIGLSQLWMSQRSLSEAASLAAEAGAAQVSATSLAVDGQAVIVAPQAQSAAATVFTANATGFASTGPDSPKFSSEVVGGGSCETLYRPNRCFAVPSVVVSASVPVKLGFVQFLGVGTVTITAHASASVAQNSVHS